MSESNFVKIAPSIVDVPKDELWYELELSSDRKAAVKWNVEHNKWQYMIFKEDPSNPIESGWKKDVSKLGE